MSLRTPLDRLRRAWLLAALALAAVSAAGATSAPPAPEFPTLEASHWIGTPVRMADLRGKVVLLDVWTFG